MRVRLDVPKVEPGVRVGKWLVLDVPPQSHKRGRKWLCQCECGSERWVWDGNLKAGHTKSCGCWRHERRFHMGRDLTGQRFGRLVLLRISETSRRRKWVCRCDCGAVKEIGQPGITRGTTVSCGCYQAEVRPYSNRTHHETKTQLYGSWIGMKDRCFNPNNRNYHNYGGRGITVSPEWVNDFSRFAEYVKTHLGERPSEKHSLDRADNNGHYEPDNLRWATWTDQANNKRRNRVVEWAGESHSVAEWARLLNMSAHALYDRIRKGWPAEKAFTQPVEPRKRRG